MNFSEQVLLQALGPLPDQRYCVAYSGGCDSTVLLHAAVKLRDRGHIGALRALHIHHGLHPEADQWAACCEAFCARRKVPLTVVREAVAETRQGPEAAARRVRYRVFHAHLQADEVLLQAHHADDQAETFLLRALRGAGVRGLSAIPQRRELGAGWLERPLLDIPRADLVRWACLEGLHWVEDPSNAGSEHDRNYLRNEIMPLLRARWPHVGTSLAVSAALAGETERVVRAAAAQALQAARTGAGGLAITPLLAADSALQREVVRTWAEDCGCDVPDRQSLRRVLAEAALAGPDAAPCLRWGDAELHRFADTLYLSPPLPPPPRGRTWDGAGRIALGAGAGTLCISRGAGPGLRPDCLAPGRTEIRFRTGGESCHPAGRPGSHPLKKVLQELRVAPWLRDRVPLLVDAGRILAAAGLFHAQDCHRADGADNWQVTWEPDPAHAAPLEHARFMNPPSLD